MSNNKKRSKRDESKQNVAEQTAMVTPAEQTQMEVSATIPAENKRPPIHRPGDPAAKQVRGLIPIMLGTLALSAATLLGVWMLSSNINTKLQDKASVEQMEKLTAQVSRLNGMLEDSLKQNKAALDASIKASRLDQRAWVGVKSIQMLPMEAGKPLKMEIKFSNSGKTFALDVRHTGILRLSDKLLGDVAPEDRESLEKQPKQVPTLVTLAPNGESLLPCASLAPLTDEMIAAIITGKVHVYLVGEISYTDVFKAWHTTRFFQRYVPAEQKFLAEQAHNDAD